MKPTSKPGSLRAPSCARGIPLGFVAFILVWGMVGCSKAPVAANTDDGSIQKLRQYVSQGDYEHALKASKDITSQVPPGPWNEEALYLQGYVLAYGKSDFQEVHSPLNQLLDLYPTGTFAAASQKLLADCQYWQGNYDKAIKEYKKLSANHPDSGFDSYSELQIANCLLLNDKVGDALAQYRELVEKNPTDPLADSAQLMIANTYLKLQNFKQAKLELQKLMSLTQNKDVQHSAQRELRQMEEEEPFKKGVEVTE